MKFSEYFFN